MCFSLGFCVFFSARWGESRKRKEEIDPLGEDDRIPRELESDTMCSWITTDFSGVGGSPSGGLSGKAERETRWTSE